MDLQEIVMKLVGPVKPVGCSETDRKYFDNLEELIKLTETLIDTIEEVALMDKGRTEFSIRKASEKARVFMQDLKEG